MRENRTMVYKKEVSCDGDSEFSKHPHIYLKVNDVDNIATCPYCGKIFEYILQSSL